MSRKQDEEKDYVRKMADMLKQGATLTDLACPQCASPLFRLGDGSLWCVKDEKKVIVVKEGDEAEKATGQAALDSLEMTLLRKVDDLQKKLQNEDDPEEMQKIGQTLQGLLENLERTRKFKRA